MVDECIVCGSKRKVSPYYICLWDFGRRVCKVRLVCERCQKDDRNYKVSKQRERVERERKRLREMMG